ncbi:MAG: sodium/proton-translocating pyrophosphatase, partial [Bacteroidetes bacterium]|nr:sodium/proton-translocating pyrophosphatase [Bacteroidota bacterium]
MELALILSISVLSLLFAVYLARHVLKQDRGTPEMQKIGDAIRQGAEAFLRRQYSTIAMLSVVTAGIIFFLYAFVRSPMPNDPVGPVRLASYTALAFLFGALCSGIAGYIGMFVSIRANTRTASAAMTSLNRALQISMRGGAVSGLFVVAMSLLGVGGLFGTLQAMGTPIVKIPFMIV